MPERISRSAPMIQRGHWAIVVVMTVLVAATAPVSAQAPRTPPLTGNPTPGTPQPATPNLADRITLTGCVEAVAATTGSSSDPSDARFLLTKAKREKRVPPGGGSSAAATSVTGETYRLAAIDSALSPFVGTRVEISGQVETSTPEAAPAANAKAPILRVEFVQKLATSCS